MTNKSIVCPKCNAAMTAGFILAHGGVASVAASQWVEGAPEESYWTGIKTKGRANFQVVTYRCARCGYLESYAIHSKE
jgi:hypothetical protein